MNRVQTFFALCKCYCAINVLLIPKSFANGGYVLSPIALTISCILQATCAIKLTQCGLATKQISYPDIAGKALGKKGKKVLELFLSVVHFQFTIAQLAFTIAGLKSSVEYWFGLQDLKKEYFGIVLLAGFSPLAWIRDIETFKCGFIFGFAMIIVTLITISGFCITMNIAHTNNSSGSDLRDLHKRGIVPINYESFWTTIGFSFFMYEGIGGLMPLMSATKNRDEFPTLLALALMTLTIIYISFSELCYFTFGDNLTKPIIMEMMPQNNIIIQIISCLYMINLLFSYPLTVYITNVILESFTCSSIEPGKCRKWLKNL